MVKDCNTCANYTEPDETIRYVKDFERLTQKDNFCHPRLVRLLFCELSIV